MPEQDHPAAAPVVKPVKKTGFVRRVTMTALLLALSVVLAMLENTLPALPAFLPPGVKLGLSNIPVMYALVFVRKFDALQIAVLKSVFVLLTRGAVAGFVSLCGGLVSIAVMILLSLCFREKISVMLLSIAGAVFHNLGQLAGVSVLYQTFFWVYLPLMLPAGIVTGALTALLLRFILPVFKRFK